MAAKKLPTPDDLDQVLGRLFQRDRAVRRLSRLIARQQEKVRGLVSERAWRAYLVLEELQTARLTTVAERRLKRS